MIQKPIPCPKCGNNLMIADDEYDGINRSYIIKAYCDKCGYSGVLQVTSEWADE